MFSTGFLFYTSPFDRKSDYTGFVACPYCGGNYTLKTNYYYGVTGKRETKFLVCNTNRHAKRCEGENVPLDEFKKGVTTLTKKIKDNMQFFKEYLIESFSGKDKDAKKTRIAEIDKEIASLKERLKEFVDKFDDYSIALGKELMEKISYLTSERLNLENSLLIAGSAESRAKNILKEFEAIPTIIKEFEDFDFRKLYSRAVVMNKSEVLLIVGNPDVSKLPLSSVGELKIQVSYKVKITDYHINFSVYANI